MTKRQAFSDYLRHEIEVSGLSRYRISKKTGIAESTLSRFMAGKGGLSLEGIDAIWLLLNLPKRRRSAKRNGRSKAKGS